jgi:predicted MFS family arabinose efflux permease
MAIHCSEVPDNENFLNNISRTFAWVVFALTFGLLLSDYMSRQVLNAVFPLLKAEWAITDAQLGSLSGIVALMVGLLTFPLSLLADRFGRVKSVVLMAACWSLATLACGIAKSYDQMLVARLFVGVGEAAYGSVGLAVVLSVFPKQLRASVTGAFMAGGMFGSVIGVALGGAIATKFGWRTAFIWMAIVGLVLAAIYLLSVKSSKVPLGAANKSRKGGDYKKAFGTLFGSRSVVAAYVGNGLQMFVGGAMIAWLPSYLNRYYQMDMARAGAIAGVLLLVSGVGMTVCGILCDRLSRKNIRGKIWLVIGYCSLCFIVLTVGFSLPPGKLQLVFVALGMFVAASTTGAGGAMVANLTHRSIHATSLATYTLAQNLIGMAPAPLVVGALADRFGLNTAMQLLPIASVLSAMVFLYGARHYRQDIEKVKLRDGELSEASA